MKVLQSKIWFVLSIFLGIIFVVNIIPGNVLHNMESMRMEYIDLKEDIVGEQLMHGDYKCCLEKPCTICIEKTPGHGEGAKCSCLEDVMNGVHPCGECIGEILEGHGNPYIAKYFATAIGEKTGHTEVIKEIIAEKYDVPVEEQI